LFMTSLLNLTLPAMSDDVATDGHSFHQTRASLPLTMTTTMTAIEETMEDVAPLAALTLSATMTASESFPLPLTTELENDATNDPPVTSPTQHDRPRSTGNCSSACRITPQRVMDGCAAGAENDTSGTNFLSLQYPHVYAHHSLRQTVDSHICALVAAFSKPTCTANLAQSAP